MYLAAAQLFVPIELTIATFKESTEHAPSGHERESSVFQSLSS